MLSGLALNALVGWWWADPIAALGIVVLLVRDGVEAIRGEEDGEAGRDNEAGQPHAVLPSEDY